MGCIVHGVAESDTTEQLSLSSHKACGGGNDSCRQERSCGGFCKNKFQTQLTYKKSTETGTFSSHPLGGGETPNGHRTRCSASPIITGGMPIKTTTRHQIPSEKMVILTVCKQEMGEIAGEDGPPPPYMSCGKVHWQ